MPITPLLALWQRNWNQFLSVSADGFTAKPFQVVESTHSSFDACKMFNYRCSSIERIQPDCRTMRKLQFIGIWKRSLTFLSKFSQANVRETLKFYQFTRYNFFCWKAKLKILQLLLTKLRRCFRAAAGILQSVFPIDFWDRRTFARTNSPATHKQTAGLFCASFVISCKLSESEFGEEVALKSRVSMQISWIKFGRNCLQAKFSLKNKSNWALRFRFVRELLLTGVRTMHGPRKVGNFYLVDRQQDRLS